MSDHPSRLAAFITELKRRRVFRVAVVYAGIAFIIVQIMDGTFEPMGIPDWVSRLIIILLALGFPIAIGMAWAFDITEEGLVRAKPKREPTAAKAPRHPLVGNKALAVIAAVAVAVAVWSWLGRPSTAGTITSLAVLPFDNLSGDPEQVYFVEGMHEALISELSNIGAVTVISRRSTLQYKDSEKTMPTIASELGVDAMVEGSAQLVGERVRITTQLIDSKDRHLWSNTYERDLEDVFALYNDVTRAIAQEIQAKLTPQEETRLASAPQVNPEAYELYLKGWHFRNLQTSESMPKAVEYLEQAVALDSTFALAWAALGHSYLMMTWHSGWNSDYALNRMKQALDKALELDPNLPDAHAGLGYYQFSQMDIAAAEASFKRALEPNPDNVYARIEYGWFLCRIGRPNDAIAEFRRAQELDPLNPLPLEGFGAVYHLIRQYDKALEYRQAALELQPGFDTSRGGIRLAEGAILMQQGRYAEAAAEMEKAYAEIDAEWFKAEYFWLQSQAEWALGNKEKVYSVRDSLRSTGELQQREQENPFWSARLYAIIGGQEKALSLLERAYEDTTEELSFLQGLLYYPEFDFLRAEPRFKALLQKMGLTEVFDQYGQRIR